MSNVRNVSKYIEMTSTAEVIKELTEFATEAMLENISIHDIDISIDTDAYTLDLFYKRPMTPSELEERKAKEIEEREALREHKLIAYNKLKEELGL